MRGNAENKNWVRTNCLPLLNANVFRNTAYVGSVCAYVCLCVCLCRCVRVRACVLIPDDKAQTVRCVCSLKHLSAP